MYDTPVQLFRERWGSSAGLVLLVPGLRSVWVGFGAVVLVTSRGTGGYCCRELSESQLQACSFPVGVFITLLGHLLECSHCLVPTTLRKIFIQL